MAERKRYTESTIRNYWVNTNIWHEKFDSPEEFLEPGNCFACGMNYGYIERAHIKALVSGGEDYPSNIHILCRHCHQDSELMHGKVYDLWFHSRNLTHVMLRMLAQYNVINLDGSTNEKLSQEYQTAFKKTRQKAESVDL